MTKTLSTEKWLVAVAIVAFVAAIYAHTFVEFAQGWHEEENMQGVAVVPIVAFLIWMRWGSLKKTPIRGNIPIGLTVLILALAVQVAGVWLGLNRAIGYLFVLAVVGLCLYFLGTAMTRALAFPLAFLLFMVPTPGGAIDYFSQPLEVMSARVAAILGGLSGIPVQASGNELLIPSRQIDLSVAQGCSGIHSLTAMCMLAALLAYFMMIPNLYKWLLLAAGIPLALIGNIFRIYLVILIANARGQVAGLQFHDGLVGKLVPFLIAFLVLIALGRLIEWQQARRNEPEPTATA